MSNTALGAALTIDDSVLAKIQEAENKIIRLEQTTRTSADKIVKSFRNAGDVGIQYFIEKLKLAQTELNNINMPKIDFGKNVNFGQVGQQATELANSVTKVSVAINKIGNVDNQLNPKNSVLAWQGLQKNIEQLEKRQQDLINVTKDYENTLTRIQSGKDGVLAQDMQSQYKAAQAELAANKQLIESYRQKQQAIINYQAEQRKQIENAQALRNFESQQSSLPEQRKAEELRKMNEYYRELEKVSKRQAEQAAKDAEKEANARKKAEEATRRQMEAENRRRANNIDKENTAALTAYNRAMAASEGTITQRINKIAKLKQAEEQLSRAQRNSTQEITKVRQEIERLTKANEAQVASYSKIQKSHSSLMNTSDQLARKLALIFSVSQIQGYVNKLIQVRGEFEKQNTALASILQNKDQADKLFGQITELAVKSPFTVKELTTYTKSLAAYQFQYEELYDTTKRLADVASGLGVDMQRLILAVGQVKAAGYLRGTETRQFTEAGFNILGELAKYYSELENRIVSVGEVQERQFKRMIAFQDVEEVFRRVTDAGGMFYQMQEKQAETLAGQMSNLKDSIDLMFNSIGKANDGTLKDMVALVRSFIENWQEVVFVLKPAVAALGTWKALTLLASIGNKKFALSLYAIATNAKTATASISLMTRATTMLAAVGRGLMSVFAIAIPVALIAGVMELYRVTTKASREANELKKALDGISNEGFVRASELISNFKILAEKAVEAADGSKEQQAALEELQRTYKDILPERDLEIDKLRELKGEYDNVTTAIYSKIEAQIKEKQIQEVSNTYGTAASEAMDALAKRLTDYNISLSTAKTITNEFKKMLEQGMIKDANQAKTELENLIRVFSGQYVSLGEKNIWQRLGWTTGVDVIDEIDDAFNAFTRFSNEVKNLEGEPIMPFRIGGGTEMYQTLKEELNNIAKFKDDWEKQNKDKFKFKVEFNEESKNALIAEYQKFIADLNSKISSGQIKQGDILSANLIIEEAQKAIEKLDVSPQIAQVNDLRVEFSKLYNIDFEKFNFTKMLEGQSFNDFLKQLDAGIKGYKDALKEFRDATEQGLEMPFMQKQYLEKNYGTEEYLNKLIPALENYRKSIALTTKEESKSGKDTTSQVFKDRLSFFERANKEYEKLLQNYSKEEARAKVLKTMMAEAEERKVGGIFMSAEFDDKGTLDSFNKVRAMYKQLPEDLQAEFLKRFGAIEIGIDIEVRQDRVKAIQDQFSDLFGNYELSLELDKLGLDKSLMSGLFDVDVFDLSEVQDKIDAAWIEMANKQEQEDAKRENRTAKSFSNITDAIAKFGNEGAEEYAAMQKQITDAEAKELEERLKRYAEYLKKSVSERVRIEQDAQKEIAKVQETKQLTTEQKVQVTAAISKETNEKLASLAFKEFKGTDLYAKVFDDLGRAGDLAITTLLQRLDEFSKTTGKELPVNEFKELIGVLKKVREEAESRDLFGTLVSGLREWQESISEVAKAEQDLETIINGGSVSEEYIDANGKIVTTILTRAKAEENLIKAQDKQKNAQTKVVNSTKSIQQAYSQVSDSISSALSQFQEFAEAMGAELSPEMQGLIDGMAKGFTFVATALGLVVAAEIAVTTAGTAMMAVLWPLLAIGAAVGAIFAISAIHDNKRQAIIEQEQENVERLQIAYEDLQRTVEKGLSLSQYASNSKMVANLQQQIESYNRMIAAEKDKKKSDDDQIKQWEAEIKDLTNQIADTYDNLREELVGNFKSLSEELGDAIVTAFAEGENAAAKWGETVDDIIGDILKNLLIQKYLEPQLQSALDEYFEATMPKTSAAEDAYAKVEEARRTYAEMAEKSVSEFGGASLLEQVSNRQKALYEANLNLAAAVAEWEKLNAAAAGEIPQITEEATNKLDKDITGLGEGFQGVLEGLPESLRKYFEGQTGDTMTSLSKSISGITESQADALSAITESIRYFASDSNLQLRTILATLTAPAPENPFLLELKAQTEQLRTMNSLWNSLSKTSTGNGKVLKVQIV